MVIPQILMINVPNLVLQFVLMFFTLFSKVFTNISKIYELPKINNMIPKYCQTLVITIIIYQVNFTSQLHLASKLYPYQFY